MEHNPLEPLAVKLDWKSHTFLICNEEVPFLSSARTSEEKVTFIFLKTTSGDVPVSIEELKKFLFVTSRESRLPPHHLNPRILEKNEGKPRRIERIGVRLDDKARVQKVVEYIMSQRKSWFPRNMPLFLSRHKTKLGGNLLVLPEGDILVHGGQPIREDAPHLTLALNFNDARHPHWVKRKTRDEKASNEWAVLERINGFIDEKEAKGEAVLGLIRHLLAEYTNKDKTKKRVYLPKFCSDLWDVYIALVKDPNSHSLADIIKSAYHAACGLEILHGLEISPRDVKLENIVVSDNFSSFLIDLELAHDFHQGPCKSFGGSYGYLSYFECRAYCEDRDLTHAILTRGDIWKLGLVLYILRYRKFPEFYEIQRDYTPPKEVDPDVALKIMLQESMECMEAVIEDFDPDDTLDEIILYCWELALETEPNAGELKIMLWNWLETNEKAQKKADPTQH